VQVMATQRIGMMKGLREVNSVVLEVGGSGVRDIFGCGEVE
jgi:hypothetical protein